METKNAQIDSASFLRSLREQFIQFIMECPQEARIAWALYVMKLSVSTYLAGGSFAALLEILEQNAEHVPFFQTSRILGLVEFRKEKKILVETPNTHDDYIEMILSDICQYIFEKHPILLDIDNHAGEADSETYNTHLRNLHDFALLYGSSNYPINDIPFTVIMYRTSSLLRLWRAFSIPDFEALQQAIE